MRVSVSPATGIPFRDRAPIKCEVSCCGHRTSYLRAACANGHENGGSYLPCESDAVFSVFSAECAAAMSMISLESREPIKDLIDRDSMQAR